MKLTKLVLMMLILLFTFGGCSNMNNLDNQAVFLEFSQEEKKEYLSDYFFNNYGIKCEMSSLKKRQVSVFENEEMFFGVAHIDDIHGFTAWVDDSGQVYDTYFALILSDEVNNLLSERLTGLVDNYKVFDLFMFTDIYSKKWNSDDDLYNMLLEEPILNNIYLVIEGDKSNINEETIKELLHGLRGNVYVYSVEDVQEVTSVSDVISNEYTKYVILN